MSKETVFYKQYCGDDLDDLDRDMSELFDYTKVDIPTDEYGFIKGKIRVHVTYCSEDDCDCQGFSHNTDCPHWVLPW